MLIKDTVLIFAAVDRINSITTHAAAENHRFLFCILLMVEIRKHTKHRILLIL